MYRRTKAGNERGEFATGDDGGVLRGRGDMAIFKSEATALKHVGNWPLLYK